jgi:hypothetical protein
MPYPFSRKDKFLSSLAVALLITVGTNAGPAHIFLQSSFHRPHISLKNSLYNNEEAGWMKNPDTPGIKHTNGVLSRYIRRERNSDLVIAVPDAQSGKYKVRFFDENDKLLFEIKQIRDSLLIVEKLNFQHAGTFQYELYKGDLLVERNTFLIKQD